MTEAEEDMMFDDLADDMDRLGELVFERKPEHGSPEWLAARHRDSEGRARLTASVAGAIMGEHEFLEPADLAIMELKDEPPSPEMTLEMQRGHDLEPVLLDVWARQYDELVERPTEMFVRGRWLANLDGVCWGRNAPVEAKSTTHYFSDKLFGQKPFRYWKWQGVAQRMIFNGAEGYVYWAIIDPELRWKFYEQYVEQAEIEKLAAAGEDWLSYIDLGIPPLGVDLEATHVAQLNMGVTGAIELPDEARDWVIQLRQARAWAKQAEAAEKEAKNWLAQHLAGGDTGQVNGEVIVTWKEQQGRTGLDRSRLALEQPQILDEYTTRGEPFRVMLPKGDLG